MRRSWIPVLLCIGIGCNPFGSSGSSGSGGTNQGGNSGNGGWNIPNITGSSTSGTSGTNGTTSTTVAPVQSGSFRPGHIQPFTPTNPPQRMSVTGPVMPQMALAGGICNDVQDGGPVNGPDCITEDVQCDTTIFGHTVGGVHRFETEWYDDNFCWPGIVNWEGGDERVYRLNLPAPIVATVTLETPCSNLDLLAAKYDGGSRCPDDNRNLSHCESRRRKGTTTEVVYLNTHGVWLLIVEGEADEEGPFALHIECGQWF